MDIYSMSDQELLARMIMAEGGQESYLGQTGIGAVVRNRMASPAFPNTMQGVITQPWQFSALNAVTGANSQNGANNAWQGAIPDSINQLAADIVAGRYEDPTGGALNYANPDYVDPGNRGWVNNMANQTRIGNHVFGTAQAGSRGSGDAQISTRGNVGLVGSGTDRLPDVGNSAPQTLGDRVRSFFGKGPGNDNPTVSAKRYAQRAGRMYDAAEDSQDVFSSNAPVSWLNVLHTAAAQGAAGYSEARQAEAEAEVQERLQSLMASGQMDPRTIAQVMALDPEMGRMLQGQAWRVEDREDSQDFQRERDAARDRRSDFEYERGRADQLEDEERKADMAKELATFKSGLPTDRVREIDQIMDRAGITEDNPEYSRIWQENYDTVFGSSKTDGRTSLQKNLEGAGYVPGTIAYQQRMEYLMDPKHSAEAEAARISRTDSEGWNKQLNSKTATRLDAMITTANRAPKQLGSLDRMEKALGNIRTGIGAGAATTVGQVMSYLGVSLDDIPAEFRAIFDEFDINPESAASAEIITALSNEMVTGMIGTDGFPANNFSDADRDFLTAIFPGITDTEIGAYEKIAQLKYMYTQAAIKQERWFEYREKHGDSRQSYEEFEAMFNKEAIMHMDMDKQAIIYSMIEDADREQGIMHIDGMTQEEVDALPSGTRIRDPYSNKVMTKK